MLVAILLHLDKLQGETSLDATTCSLETFAVHHLSLASLTLKRVQTPRQKQQQQSIAARKARLQHAHRSRDGYSTSSHIHIILVLTNSDMDTLPQRFIPPMMRWISAAATFRQGNTASPSCARERRARQRLAAFVSRMTSTKLCRVHQILDLKVIYIFSESIMYSL